MKFLHIMDVLNAHPKYVSWLGVVAGVASVDFLRLAQIFGAVVTGLVALCALILSAPKAVKEVRSWFVRG